MTTSGRNERQRIQRPLRVQAFFPTQKRHVAKTEGLPTTRKTQRRKESDTDVLNVARYPAVGRPGTAGNGINSETELSCRIPFPAASALSERWSRHFFFPFNGRGWHAPSSLSGKGKRQNRRACGTAAGENPANDESSLSETAGFSPATGDPIACRSTLKVRYRLTFSAIASWWGWVDGWNFVFLVSSWLWVGGRLCVFSVSLCLCGDSRLPL